MGLISLIANRNYIIVNKILAQKFGVDCALLLGELASEFEYWEKEGKVEDGFFFSTIENVMENTTLSDKKQRNALNALRDAGIVEVKLKGLPAKRYIKIKEEQLLPYLLNNSGGNGGASSAEMEDLETPKQQSNNNNSNNNKNSNNQERKNIKKEAEEKRAEEFEEILSSIADLELIKTYLGFLEMRKEIKSPMTPNALQILIKRVNKLEPNSREKQIDLLETAILNKWKSVYPNKDDRRGKPTKNTVNNPKGRVAGSSVGAFWDELQDLYDGEE
jgi:hypothetical protein